MNITTVVPRLVSLGAAAGLLLLLIAPMAGTRTAFLFYLMIWITMASAFSIIYGMTGYLPFGYVAFYGIGAYATAMTWLHLKWPVPVAIVLSGLIAVSVAVLFFPTLRLRGIYFAIVNLACALAVRALISNAPTGWTGGSFGLSMARAYQPVVAYYMALGVMVAAVATHRWISRSRLGIALRSIKQDPVAAEVAGIDTTRSKLYAWLIAAFFPALAGGLEAWYSAAIDPRSAFDVLITARSVVYAMFGGLGTVVGPVVGASVLFWLDDLIWRLFPLLNVFLVGFMMVMLILFLPRGVTGELVRRYPHLRRYLS